MTAPGPRAIQSLGELQPGDRLVSRGSREPVATIIESGPGGGWLAVVTVRITKAGDWLLLPREERS